ncbi:VIT domain-containing protein, partial [Oleiphilus sp. HI0117]
MSPANGQLPALEIKQHHVDVTIEDGYAITSVTQLFFNPNDTTLEAIYSFPIPEKAAVGEFTYWIDGKAVTGEVLEKKQAREIYEQEKAQGRETALTEQDEYKSFDSAVYPVLPKQDVKIRLVYIQAVHSDHGIGSYVYPLEDGGVDEEKLAFWSYNEVVTEAFSFKMNIRSSYPIDDVRLPKHPQAIVTSNTNQAWHISMMNGQAAQNEEDSNPITAKQSITKLDQDIVVYWRHQQGLPGSIDMVTHKEPGKDKGTFMMTITPGDDLSKINLGRDWIFVLDYSGSM